ncbi:MAG: potassium channel family protein [Candidatus Omnitrophica bacterium]|nr:potassium channel family protein [Candidatus Omnitrophota bacterium]
MRNIIKIFVNDDLSNKEKPLSAYLQQVNYLKKLWDTPSYGLERVFRLFVCFSQFFFPIILIREIFGRFGSWVRKLAVELYTLFKVIFPMYILFSRLYHNKLIIFILIYLLMETIFHILNLIFLSQIHSLVISYHRSLLLLFLHYIEVVLDYANIYIGFDLLNRQLSPISALYFSLVANTTVGFGDICPKDGLGQIVVMSQLGIGVLFVFLFINYFFQRQEE